MSHVGESFAHDLVLSCCVGSNAVGQGQLHPWPTAFATELEKERHVNPRLRQGQRHTGLAMICAAWSVAVLLCGAVAYAADAAPAATMPAPETHVIARWHGTWDVTAKRRHPLPAATVTYVETYEWVLDGRFLRSHTAQRSEGTDTMSMVWYDLFTKSYRFAVYDAAGFALELPPPTWDETTQTMAWRSRMFAPVSFDGHARFVDADTIEWASRLKDWKGTMLLDLEGRSVRRRQRTP